MTNKTRVLHVRVVGFSAQERQMLNSIFLLSVAPARQIGYKNWVAESGVAPDMYLLDGDSDSAVASWQATFASTSERTLVVGSKNIDLGVASASRPLGLKVVGAMDRLAIALKNAAQEAAAHDVSAPTAAESLPAPSPAPKQSAPAPRVVSGMSAQSPLSISMNAMAPMSAGANTLSGGSRAVTASAAAMTSVAPAANVLPSMTLTPAVFEKPVPEKTVDRILSDKPLEKEKLVVMSAPLPMSGVTPLSPSALSAAVAPSTSATRTNLRVVPTSPLATSLPAAARVAEAPAPHAPVAPAGPAPVAAAPVAAAPVFTAPVAAAPAPVAPPVAVAPPAPVATVTPVTPVTPVAPTAAPTPRHEEHNFRVLAVDDSPLMRTFLNNKLQPYGILPEFASSGEEALFKISKQHFDMIFLDVMLPGMDGYDVCKMIKKNKDNSLMKVVMLTSKDRTFDKIRGTMAGCDGYLTKPVDEMKLRAIIERHTVTRK
jgi:CheY-like chemotaxis protein